LKNELRRRLLIVEDAEEIRTTMAELLAAEGYEVQAAANGREALTLLASAKLEELPHLILLDLMMPTMDGAQFRAEQRKHPQLAKIPVLLMTAGGDIEGKAIDLGACGYLKKPFKDIDTILHTIDRSLVNRVET
jgi:CheY-like chemotaxis protein